MELIISEIETKKQHFLCLNMIVKNEAHIIKDTLIKLLNKIQFDYWVISDTGSTDNTKEIISEFFKERNIEGELYDDEWKDFGYNRTLALEHAYKKSKYVIIFDADDEIAGNFILPELTKDSYYFQFGSEHGISYIRQQIVNNHKRWKYVGVLHEIITCLEPNIPPEIIKGDYYTISGRTSSRNKDGNKYLKDALILEKEYEECFNKKDNLYIRYGFYCANSFFDAGKFEDAIKWYKITLNNNNWSQEKYVACSRLYSCYNQLDNTETGLYYLVKAFEYDKERFECLHELVCYYCGNNLNDVAYAYYSIVKDYYENKYLLDGVNDKLFLDIIKSDFYLPYYMIIVCDRVKKYVEAKCFFKVLFTKKFKQFNGAYIGNILYNLQFFIEYYKDDKDFINLFQEYINFLKSNNYPLYRYDFLLKYEKYGVKINLNIKSYFSEEECKLSNKILIYTGFSPQRWNYTFAENNALGGSETAVLCLAKELSKNYNIYISGDVDEENKNNISFIQSSNLSKLLKTNAFNTIIISRYLNFYELYPYFSSFKTYIWGHDIILFNYGSSLTVSQILQKYENKINGCICQTEWHKNLFASQYPELKEKFYIINNGIDISLIPTKNTKFNNRFVYTSCSERGLDRLLELWPSICENLTDAELYISSYNSFPHNQFENNLNNIIQKYSNIKHVGKLNKKELYNLISSAEYWLYPTNFNETSCITAMEMLACEVICMYYPIAGLNDTLQDYGIKIKRDNEIDTILNLNNKIKNELRKAGKKYVLSCTWENRAYLWNNLFTNYNITNISNEISSDINNISDYPDLHDGCIKIINLENRNDRRNIMIKQLNNNNIKKYDFFTAINGKKLNFTSELYRLFEQNDFKFKKGVIGCALSHLTLWDQLANDPNNNFYVILEDDINLCDNFRKYLNIACKLFVDNKLEHLALGEYNTTKQFPDDSIKINFYSKDLYKEWNTAFSYIISKDAASKALEYINTCSLKCAIDNPQAFGYIFNYSSLNVKLVNCQIINEFGTDIQTTNETDFFDINHFKIKDKKCLTISFCDWWEREYSGGIFDKNNNFFINLLRDYENPYIDNIKIVNPTENPDILFYSIFGYSHKTCSSGRKIFFSGEPYSQRNDADFNITFDKNNNKNTRVPLWLCYFSNSLIEECNKRKNGKNIIPIREKFCSFIATGPGLAGNRKEFVEKLSKYKQVDCGGNYLNNIGYNVPLGLNCSGKIEHNNNYKFAMAFESTIYPGYVTEKLCDVFKSNCIPIYWGHPDVVKDFNPKTFINANDFSDFDELIKYIIKVDNDNELYKSYFTEPMLSNEWLDILNDPNKTFFKNLVDKILGKSKNLFDNYKNIKKNENEHIYYAGNKIDEFLSTYIFKQHKNGYFVDVGANDGVTINNTLFFEKYYNWSGINVEPLDEPYNKLIINRPNSINLNLAIDNKDGETEFIYNTGYTEMISGLKKTYDPRHFNRLTNELHANGGTSTLKIVKTKTLKTIFRENCITHINYLSIDVEGGEKNVLESIDFNDVFIDVISFEDNFSDVTKGVIKFMEENNYIFVGRFGDIIMIHKNSKFISNLDCDKIMSLTYENFRCFGLQPNIELKKSIVTLCKNNSDLWVFYAFNGHNYNVLEDYINSLNEEYNIVYTKDVDYVFSCKPKKISYVMYINDDKIINKYKNSNVELSFLNTEPLSIEYNLHLLKSYINKYPFLKIYDYSYSNLQIILQNNMYAEVLEYKTYKKENKILSELLLNEPKIYDFGIITYGNTETNTIDNLAYKKKETVSYLIKNGFKIHIISGWGLERDKELAKCKVILNIHSILAINDKMYYSKTFENIRCNRLLDAGFKILSEDSIHSNEIINKYKGNLKFIDYETIKNIKYSENFWDMVEKYNN